jgi:N-acetylglucosaminyldiphosphoundecaprenol N-acetyl-beta-D-mannosaminyltransferase
LVGTIDSSGVIDRGDIAARRPDTHNLRDADVALEPVRRQDARANALPRVNILGVGVMPLTLAQVVDTLDGWRRDGRRDYVCCVSVHGVVTAQRDPAVRGALNGAGLATQDGMPLVWWSRHAGYRNTSRACGPDLMEAICAVSAERGYRHYFYGGSPAVLERLIASLKQRHPGLIVAGHHAPPFRKLSDAEDAADVAAINAAQADFVWVGLGMPKQEKWIAAHVGRIDATALLGVGAAFDFHAGATPRAPKWMQRTGSEWLFRLASEPRRLARRYLVDNMIFVLRAAQQLAGWKTYAADW